MTQFNFIALCEKYLIAPSIAMENEDLCAALVRKDDEEVERILREEF